MDEQLEQRWKTGKAPFDGQCIRLTERLEVTSAKAYFDETYAG
jgi:hypothetical protein